jgi:hypothetical protein
MQAATAPQAPTALPPPPAPGGAAAGAPRAVTTTTSPVLSLDELRARRSEISSQLSNVTSRRSEIAGELRKSLPGADRAGLESRLAVLDGRIAALESDLASTGRELATARGLESITSVPPPQPGNGLDRDQITAISIVFTVVVLMPLSIAWARAIFRRASRQAEQPSQQLMSRLDRMEEGIETIALEVERISEGQRFVTKVISAGAAEPVAIPNRERVELER